MKVLTVKNPWAWLIIHGGKDIENRTWKTNFRGRVLIHVAQWPDEYAGAFLNKIYGALDHNTRRFLRSPKSTQLRFGQIIGSVEIVDCVRDHSSVWAQPDCWHWVLRDPQPITFRDGEIVKGKLGLWEIKTQAEEVSHA